MSQIYLAIDARQASQLRAALQVLRSQFGALAVSTPWCADTDPEPSVHLAVCATSIVPVSELNATLEAIGQRTDTGIHLLLLGNAVIKDGDLQLPHPQLAEHAPWLRALASLAPDLLHPGTGRSFRDLAQALPASGLQPLGYNIE